MPAGAGAASTDARGHSARRIRALSREQRSALLPSRHPRRSGQEDRVAARTASASGCSKDDSRIQLDLYANLDRRQDPARRGAAEVRARAEHRLRGLSRDAEGGPRIHRSTSTTPARRRKRAASAGSRSARIRRARPGSPPRAKGRAPASGGRTRISGATSRRAWRSASRFPSDLVDVSNGKFIGKTDVGGGYTRWDWRVHYPINSYNVSLNIGSYVHFDRRAGRPAARLLRAARQPGEGEDAVRAGQADDRGVSEGLRRLPVREGRLQADRSAVLRHGAPERRHLRQSLRQRLSRARLDRRRHQPQVRLHHHPRERARMVRQRRLRGRRVRHVDSRGLDDVSRGRLRRAAVRLRRGAEIRERLQVEGRRTRSRSSRSAASTARRGRISISRARCSSTRCGASWRIWPG